MKRSPIKIYNRDYVDFSTFQELPVNKQPFEGPLYLDYGNNNWVKRLFRFNGETLVCLSSTLVRLPARVTNSTKDASESLYALLSANTASKDQYHIPEWTIDIKSVASIALLQNKLTKNGSTHAPVYYLSIKTLNGIRRDLKSPCHEDLDRWAFVLTKMWNSTKSQQKHDLKSYVTPTNNNEPVSTKVPPFYLSREEIQRNSLSKAPPPTKTAWIEDWIGSLVQLSLDDVSQHEERRLSYMYEPLDLDATSSVSSQSIQTKTSMPLDHFFHDVNTTETDKLSNYYGQCSLSYHPSNKAQRVQLMKPADSIKESHELSPTSRKHMSYLELEKSPLDQIGKKAYYTNNIYQHTT